MTPQVRKPGRGDAEAAQDAARYRKYDASPAPSVPVMPEHPVRDNDAHKTKPPRTNVGRMKRSSNWGIPRRTSILDAPTPYPMLLTGRSLIGREFLRYP